MRDEVESAIQAVSIGRAADLLALTARNLIDDSIGPIQWEFITKACLACESALKVCEFALDCLNADEVDIYPEVMSAHRLLTKEMFNMRERMDELVYQANENGYVIHS